MIATLPQVASPESIGTSFMESTEEYRDNDYNYALQFPTNWTRQKVPKAGLLGEMRILLKGPTCSVSASIERGGASIYRKTV